QTQRAAGGGHRQHREGGRLTGPVRGHTYGCRTGDGHYCRVDREGGALLPGGDGEISRHGGDGGVAVEEGDGDRAGSRRALQANGASRRRAALGGIRREVERLDANRAEGEHRRLGNPTITGGQDHGGWRGYRPGHDREGSVSLLGRNGNAAWDTGSGAIAGKRELERSGRGDIEGDGAGGGLAAGEGGRIDGEAGQSDRHGGLADL